MKKIMVVLSATLLLWGCSDSNNKVEEESVKEEKVEVVEEKEETVIEEVEEETEEIEESVEDSVDSRIERIVSAEAILTESFQGVGKVSYDYELDIIQITPTDPAFVDDVYSLMVGIADKSAWNNLVESASGLSVVISDVVDNDIQLAILNPESTDRILLLVQDGLVIYDFADEI